MTISVEDANDNAPIWDAGVYSFDVPEDAAVGTIIGVVGAHDVDSGVAGNGKVSYVINSVWEKFTFAVDPNSGSFVVQWYRIHQSFVPRVVNHANHPN